MVLINPSCAAEEILQSPKANRPRMDMLEAFPSFNEMLNESWSKTFDPFNMVFGSWVYGKSALRNTFGSLREWSNFANENDVMRCLNRGISFQAFVKKIAIQRSDTSIRTYG